jgi:hypothetical protein
LASVPRGATVTVDLSVNYLDHAAHQAISDWQRQHVATGGTVRILGGLQTGRLAHRAVQDLVEPQDPELAEVERNPARSTLVSEPT